MPIGTSSKSTEATFRGATKELVSATLAEVARAIPTLLWTDHTDLGEPFKSLVGVSNTWKLMVIRMECGTTFQYDGSASNGETVVHLPQELAKVAFDNAFHAMKKMDQK